MTIEHEPNIRNGKCSLALFRLWLKCLLMHIIQIVRRFKRTPIVISIANGLIGRDALTNEFREVHLSLSPFSWVLFIGKLSFLGEVVVEE